MMVIILKKAPARLRGELTRWLLESGETLSPAVREVVRNLAVENAELARVRTGESGETIL